MLLTLAFRHLWVRKLRSALPAARLLARRGRDGGPALGGRGDAGPEPRRLAGGRRGGDRAAAGHRRRGDAHRRPRRDVLRHRPRPLPHPPGARRPAARRHSSAPSRRPSRASCSTSARPAPAAVRRRCGPAARSRAAPPRWEPASTSRRARWRDSPADSAYVAPTPQQLYDELDRFHIPAAPDSTWGEWQYFNLVTGPDEWWYITYLVGGALVARPARLGRPAAGDAPPRRTAGYERFTADVPAAAGPLRHRRAPTSPSARAPCASGTGSITCVARASGPAGPLRLDLEVRPRAQSLLPAGRAAGRRVPLGLRRSRPRPPLPAARSASRAL